MMAPPSKLSLRIPLVGSFVAVLVSSALVGQTPVDTAATLAAAERAAQVWLALVDKGDIAKSWDEAALAFQLAVTQDKWGGRQVVETVVPALDGKRGWRVSGYWVRLEQ